MNSKAISMTAAAGTLALAAGTSPAITDLLANLQNEDPDVRTKAWRNAGNIGTPALPALARLASNAELEVGRATRRAMWQIVRASGRPEAAAEKSAAESQLIALLGEPLPQRLKAEMIHMLAEIGGNKSVRVLDGLLDATEMREDARQALQQIPGPKSVDALRRALDEAPENFRVPIAAALRARGEVVAGLPCQKLTPTKTTHVKPVGRG